MFHPGVDGALAPGRNYVKREVMTMGDVLSMLESYADIDPPPAYWLWSDETYVDGEEYCRVCAEEQINYFGNGTSVDGGCGHIETDSCCHCATCGTLLDYALTDYGAESEMDHFRKVRFRKPLGREEAYHIARMLAAKPDDPAALQIARRAIRAITPSAPAPTG